LDINEVVLETLGLTRMEAAQNRASLRTRLSDEIQSVWADRIEVQQVILNLIMNAIEAVSEPGNEQRDVLVETARTDSNDVTLSVKDTGTGLDPTKLEHIFDAFYTTKREGMGMGLAVSRSIIEAHGGRLWATPNQPRGAVFQFILPSARDEAS
jgi:signal transduction histidine kinase